MTVSNGSDPDQDQHFASHELGPKFQTGCKCYQWMTKVATSKERGGTSYIRAVKAGSGAFTQKM